MRPEIFNFLLMSLQILIPLLIATPGVLFLLLGCVLDATGMGKAIVDLLASLIGHVKAETGRAHV